MISIGEFAGRRQRVLEKMAANSVCIVPAGRLCTRSRDTEYLFRQNSDFQYLSGFPEPDALLLLSNSPAKAGTSSVLFCLDKDPQAEIWHGRRVGPDAAARQFGFDDAFPIEQVEAFLTIYLDGHDQVYFAQGQDSEIDNLLFSTLEKLRNAPKQSKQAPHSVCDIRPVLHEMRLFKSPAEQDMMRRANRISMQAHKRAMKFAAEGKHEYQLEAEIHHEFAMQGARSPAYGTIVGSGDNACILHYTENADELKDGKLVLIDAGCELAGYAADITRTFPVSGCFSPEQAVLYQLVLDAQLAAFEQIKPGNDMQQASDAANKVLTKGLIDLGILSGGLQDNIEQLSFRKFYMHGLGHWLGLDVHDVGDYKVNGRERPFEAGMALTVEPGLYIAPDAEVDPKWRGIGIRIEDNLLITQDGFENMTDQLPKSIQDVEALMSEAVH